LLQRHARHLGRPLRALAHEVAAQQQVVLRLEEEPVRAPLLQEEVAAHDRHVGDEGVAQQAGQGRGLDGQLGLEALARATIQAAAGHQVLEIAADPLQRVLEPEEIAEAAEADIEALGRHALGQGLDLHVRSHLRHLRLFQRDRFRQRLIGCLDPRGRLPRGRLEEPVTLDRQAE